MDVKAVDFVVVGGGLAGISVAYHLSRRRLGSVLVLEREPSLGSHASSQNAAMVRRLVEDEAIARLAREGADFLAHPPPDIAAALEPGVRLFRATGCLLTAGTAAGRASLEGMVLRAVAAGVSTRLLEPHDAAALVPGLDESRISGGAWCPSDGIADPHWLITAMAKCARQRGVRIALGTAAVGAEIQGDRLTGVRTTGGAVACCAAVDASGAWAREVASVMGGPSLPLIPHRRHIAVSGPMRGFDQWPIVWDVERGFYVRPEAGRLLYCACDEDPSPPCVPEVDARILDVMAAKAEVLFPQIRFTVARSWAGLRTFTADRRFVIGPDPELRGLFWLAGLGGHGLTTAAAVGRLAAEVLDSPGDPPREVEPFLPRRLIPHSRPSEPRRPAPSSSQPSRS